MTSSARFILCLFTTFSPIALCQNNIVHHRLQIPASTSSSGIRVLQHVFGTVTDSSGAVLPAAKVELQPQGPGTAISTSTDMNGLFSFTSVASDRWRMVVSADGFESFVQDLKILPDTHLNAMHITLQVHAASTTINVTGRENELVGIASSATEGTIGAKELEDRPILRSGEVLEAVPGLIITQHAGGGKANQYYLRGFNLDHGTDFAISVDNMPLNLSSHAHGEGYSDMNIVIPEFVQRVNFDKGPYNAEVGNYGSAGSARIETIKQLPRDFLKIEGGNDHFGRTVFGLSRKLAQGTVLIGGELYYDNGPWKHPDAFAKENGLISYALGNEENGISVVARAYHGKWNSSDQIPVSAVPIVGLYGTLDPSDGGNSERYSLQQVWHHQNSNSATQIASYLFYYDLDLYSNFTYFLIDPVHGDQFEQQDRRWVTGLAASHTLFSQWSGHRVENTIGIQLRNDWINNGLYASMQRHRMTKLDYDTDDATPPVLPATRERDRFTNTLGGLYIESKIQWNRKFRTVMALRGDEAKSVVHSLAYSSAVNAANSGSATKFLPSPKASFIYAPWSNTEFYAQAGFSFHSNDSRGTTQTVEPVSADYPYPNTPAPKIPPLVQTKGGEFGLRSVAASHLQSTFSLWYLHSNSELMQDGDTGGTSASEQSSNRYGIEWANYYMPSNYLAVDFDIANSRARFTAIDGDDAAPNSNGGKRVPEAVGVVIASGIDLHDWNRLSSSLRLRYFGPRDLTSDGAFRSRHTIMLNSEVSYQITHQWRITAEFLNMLDRADSDIDYAYESRILPGLNPAGKPLGQSTFSRVAHPVEPFQLRIGMKKSF